MEELLRTALREDGAEVGPDSVRPLAVDALSQSRRAGTMRHLARWRPVFAAAAVVLIAALWLTLSTVTHGGRPPSAASPHPSPSPSATGTAVTVLPDAVPPFYAAVTAARAPAYRGPRNVTIRETYNAAVLATVSPPAGYGTFAFVTGSGRAGMWIAGAQRWHPAGFDNSAQPVTLFLLRYDTGSRRATIRRLPAPPLRDPSIDVTPHGTIRVATWLAADALSADGTGLATVVGTPAGFDVRVYALASGTVKNWAVPRLGGQAADWEFSLTWLQDNKTLAIGAGAGITTAPIWYLDTAAPGGALAAASTAVTLTFPKAKSAPKFTGPHTPATCDGAPIATSDGQRLLCSGNADFPLNFGPATSVGIWVFSARTGKVTGTVGQHTICCLVTATEYPSLIWASPRGDTLVVTGITQASEGTRLYVRPSHGPPTQIPWPGGLISYPGLGNLYEPNLAW